MTKLTEQEIMDGLDEMIKDAPGVGLCTFPFKFLRDAVSDLIEDRRKLRAYREPRTVLPYNGYAGKCPECGVVFLDDSTQFCGNCGQKIAFPAEE